MSITRRLNSAFTVRDFLSEIGIISYLLFIDWAQHGICGRGVLLDMEHWYTKKDGKLPYDPWTTYGFSVAELEACAKDEGIQFRTGDILVIRTGFIKRYYASSPQEKDQASEHLCVFVPLYLLRRTCYKFATVQGLSNLTT